MNLLHKIRLFSGLTLMVVAVIAIGTGGVFMVPPATLVAMIAGMIFVVTRDYPWTLTLPVIAVISVAALAAFYIISPNFFNAIVSGQGYLVKSKLYSTISEATAPAFSTLALSFGAVTFWLALFGVGYAAIRIPKNMSPYLVFLVVWTAVSIYMASSAGRFVFNATPAFASAQHISWIS